MQSGALADSFRADVAQAESTMSTWGPYQSDEHTLILRRKNGECIVYRWEEGTLKRITGEDRPAGEISHGAAIIAGIAAQRGLDDRAANLRPVPITGANVGVEFVQSDKLVRLRLNSNPHGKVGRTKTLEIAAALGGDWR